VFNNKIYNRKDNMIMVHQIIICQVINLLLIIALRKSTM